MPWRLVCRNEKRHCNTMIDTTSTASTATGFDITFMDGIKGDDIPGKALPPHAAEWMNSGTKGAWRTHANILREYVGHSATADFTFSRQHV